jgi:CRISPR/Cas system CSM-associated protein Csm3 (group 7 of RAMP superfamily)
VQITLSVTLRTPLCVGAAGSAGGFVDKTFQRNGSGAPIIPGSQIKGRLRHACEQVARAMGQPLCNAPYPAEMCPDAPQVARLALEEFHLARLGHNRGVTEARQCIVCAVFGSPTYPSPLRFSDAVPDRGAAGADRLHPQIRPAVGLDRRRRVAADQLLFLTETVGAGAVFTAAIGGTWYDTPITEVRRIISLLAAAAPQVTRWGGGSSRGLGWADVSIAVALNDEPLDDIWGEVEQLCRIVS